MIVDCHTHIDCSTASEQGVGEKLAAQENVDRCLVLASPDQSSEKVNDQLAKFVGKYPDKMVGFAFVDPTRDGVSAKTLAAATEKKGLKGAVLYCSACDFHPAHTRAMRLYEAAQERSVPIFFHNAGDIGPDAALDYAQPYLLDEIARKFRQLKIIIGSMGTPFIDQTLSMVSKHHNVYADLTIKPNHIWQLYTTIISAYERGVMDKLLFGSGFPFSNASECIEALLGFNKLLGDSNLPTVPRGDIRKIVERDTLELLGIEQ